ncbi:asparaginase [Lacisediminihabitans sp.]|uniref:asparaginase n=1 Tax=Lacisediminihabitans sp. TaxID=2787631 RepID=UPI002F937A36
MSHPLLAAEAVELATVSRSGFDESRHIGAAVVVSSDGSVARELGNGDALIFGRSSLKLFQAIAVLRAGVALEGAQLVVASASHGGTVDHLRIVEQLLARAGVGADALQCPIDWPLDGTARHASTAPSRLQMNCSGKHAAFLLACATNGWPTESYLEQTHPLQRLIRSTIEEFTGETIDRVGVDGCGAPVFATTLRGLATAVGRVGSATASSGDQNAARLSAAIRDNAWAIDGVGRPNTVAIEELGIVAKGGAEGVMVMGLPDGTAVALKILDGGARAATLVAIELLASVGAVARPDADRVIALTTDDVLGGGVPVGRLRASDLVLGR